MRPFLLGTTTLAIAALGAVLASPAQAKQSSYEARLTPVNAAGASGMVRLTQLGTTLDVDLSAAGLSGGPHMAHVHGVRGGQASCPTSANDSNGDGRVDLVEGLPAYGPVQLTLSDMTTDRGTRLDYERTYKHLDNGDGIASAGDITHYVIVVHGVDLDGDGLASKPDVRGDGPGHVDNEISMPALCAVITR